MEIKKVALVLVDISGYTRFLQMHAASLLHAEEIITELMEAVIDKADYPLTLNKLEGDAALLYAEVEENPQAAVHDIARQVLGFFAAFKQKQTTLVEAGEGGCPCEACRNIAQLQLKAVLHYGEVVMKQIRQFEELAGNNVILIHRLLKNSLPSREYILMTEDFYRLYGDITELAAQEHIEAYPELGALKTFVVYPPQTVELRVPDVKPMSRPKGIWEGQRLTFAGLWRRLFDRKGPFRHLQAG
ncbi:MAG: DUF2652 domain-containing protein [Anaerolineae bacterium]